MNPLAASIVRTAVSYLVAWLLSLRVAAPLMHALNIDSATAKEQLTALFVFVFGTVYYVVVRAIEDHVPAVGVLLGVPTRPTYHEPVKLRTRKAHGRRRHAEHGDHAGHAAHAPSAAGGDHPAPHVEPEHRARSGPHVEHDVEHGVEHAKRSHDAPHHEQAHRAHPAPERSHTDHPGRPEHDARPEHEPRPEHDARPEHDPRPGASEATPAHRVRDPHPRYDPNVAPGPHARPRLARRRRRGRRWWAEDYPDVRPVASASAAFVAAEDEDEDDVAPVADPKAAFAAAEAIDGSSADQPAG